MNPTFLALRHAPAILRRIVLSVPAERHDDRPVEDRFTLREVVCHVGDLERINRERVRRAMEEDVPEIENAEPDRLAAEGRYGERDVRVALDEFATERAATLAYLESLTEAQLARRLTKSIRGTFSWFRRERPTVRSIRRSSLANCTPSIWRPTRSPRRSPPSRRA